MKIIILIAILCCANPVWAQKSLAPAYRIRAVKRGLIVTFQKKSYRLDVGAQIDAAKVTETEMLFAGEKEGSRYLLIDVSGWSRAERNDRQCGAGVESNLIWLKLDAAWKISDSKSVRYQSCWSGTDLDEPFRFTRNKLNFTFDDIREKRTVKVFYNADEPEKGLQLVETGLRAISQFTALCNNLSSARIWSSSAICR